MLAYIIRRLLLLIPVVFVISVVTFVIIQLPPGDYLTTYINNLKTSGIEVSESQAEALKRQYGLDQPASTQYVMWMKNIVTIAHHPWQMIPVLFVIMTVLMYNFLGVGLRYASDPYSV